jgi:hypothetical protein
MSRYHCRCSKKACQTRRVFKRHPDEYVRLPKCTGCGGTKYRVDNWMNRRDTRKMACMCDGYIYHTRDVDTTVWAMHRKGSPYCWYRKDGTRRVEGDADFRDIRLEQEAANYDEYKETSAYQSTD